MLTKKVISVLIVVLGLAGLFLAACGPINTATACAATSSNYRDYFSV